jgi:phospholipid/cholesterol/gamma-HCH transport system permease protein
MAEAAAARGAGAAQFDVQAVAADTACLRLIGAWQARTGLPAASEALGRIKAQSGVERLVFDSTGLTVWDTGLLTFLAKLDQLIEDSGLSADPDGLPDGVQPLLRLALAVPERSGAQRHAAKESFLARIGKETQALWQASVEVLTFLGEVIIAFGRLLRGHARFRRSDLLLTVQQVGVQALPLVGLISFLVGVILAFLGAIQLAQFGAQIFVADLVGIGMARDMAAMMVGIMLAGRTGAAFAAELGTMQVNEEIDALRTFGIDPMEFQVLPRMLALILMTPLLYLYGTAMGILGGMLVGVVILDLPAITYYQQTAAAVPLIYFLGGLIKAAVYGAIIALVGCLRGMQCGRSSSAVGQATTSAVVTSIVGIIFAMAILTVVYDVLGI